MLLFRRSLFLWAGLLGLFLAPTASAAAPWIKLRVGEITIYSNAAQKDVTEFAVGYVAFRKTFRELLVPGTGQFPTTILLYRSLSQLEPLLPKSEHKDSHTISYSGEIDGTAFLVLAVDGDRRTALQQTYEFDTVWALRRSGVFVPVWMSQGAGEVLASLTLRGSTCTVGDGPDNLSQQWEHNALIEWPDFFLISNQSEEYLGSNARFHGQAWALMHWLLLHDDHGRERFSDLATRLRTEPGLKATEAVLGMPEREFERALRRHFRSDHTTRQFAFDAPAVRAQLKVEPAPEAELCVQRANLLFLTRKKYEASLELNRARVLAPESPLVKEALARAAAFDGDQDEAIRLFREAIAAGSTNSMAYLHSARRRLDEQSSGGVDRGGGGGNDVQNAIAELRQVVTLDPGSVEGYRLLGRAFFVSPKLEPANVEELNPGIGSAPGCDAVRWYRAMLWQRLSRPDDALTDFHYLATDGSVSPKLRKLAQDRIADLAFTDLKKKLESLVKEHRIEEALTSLAEAKAQPDIAIGADDIQKLGTWLEEVEAWQKLAEARRTAAPEDVKRQAQSFLEKYPRSRVAPDARKVLAEAERRAAAAARAASGN